uniref:Calpain catalytic domain-containing protein n=1 Tax=Lotharella globosa TaxID=91324 RepID=A0A6V3M6Q4_9EUKA|mmetsp:Transcript_18301/g.36918  ORF Transcript_18301/g.36918 Transcript_18301/m.36918 type:complete len:551 (+) Transcript_18301:91-1743(+)
MPEHGRFHRRRRKFMPRKIDASEKAIEQLYARYKVNAGMDATQIEAKLMGKTKFVDSEFPPQLVSVTGDTKGNLEGKRRARENLEDFEGLRWARPEEIYHDITIFKKGRGDKDAIEPNDIDQGTLGDCWFCSALACLAENPAHITKALVTKKWSKSGAYDVRLCIAGVWQIVTVDDCLPVHENGDPVFLSSKDHDLWVMLIEKAYAKVHGSYLSLAGGFSAMAFEDITGCAAETLQFSTVMKGDPVKLWDFFVKHTSQEDPVCISSISRPKECGFTEKEWKKTGIFSGHAYSVLDAKEHKGLRLLQVRNPWGGSESKLDFNDDDREHWTPELIKAFGATFKEDGTFFIKFEDVLRCFNLVDICYMHGADCHPFQASRASSTFTTGDAKQLSHCWRFEITKETEVVASIHQKDERDPRVPRYIDHRVIIADAASRGTVYAHKASMRKKSTVARCTLEPGSYVLIAHTTGRRMAKLGYTEAPFAVSLHAAESTKLVPVDHRLASNHAEQALMSMNGDVRSCASDKMQKYAGSQSSTLGIRIPSCAYVRPCVF